MHPKRRLPHRVQTKKSQRHFSRIVLFVFVAVTVMVAGGYYFLNKPSDKLVEVKRIESLEKTIIHLEEEGLEEDGALLPPTLDEENEEAIMDDVFSDSELVQLYKVQEGVSSSNYWQWPLKQCAWSGSAIALVVHQEEILSPEDLHLLEKLGIPLTLAILPDQASYDRASSWAQSHDYGLFLSLPLLQPNTPKEMGDQLEDLLQGKKALRGVLSPSEGFSKEALEPLLLHLKRRGLVLLDRSSGDGTAWEEVSDKTLALSLKQDVLADSVASLPKIQKGSKPLIVTIPLKKQLLSKIVPWIKQQQKKGISFVGVTDLFCRP
jgi:polysaccharide deacetylase 2 family uncharacterized protein YibQ